MNSKTSSPINVRFPYQYDGRGKTQECDTEEYIKGLIEHILFCSPGERLMRPDFGSGLNQLMFEPNSPELAASTQALAHGALQQWLDGLIEVNEVDVQSQDSQLRVLVSYVLRRSQSFHQVEFSKEMTL